MEPLHTFLTKTACGRGSCTPWLEMLRSTVQSQLLRDSLTSPFRVRWLHCVNFTRGLYTVKLPVFYCFTIYDKQLKTSIIFCPRLKIFFLTETTLFIRWRGSASEGRVEFQNAQASTTHRGTERCFSNFRSWPGQVSCSITRWPTSKKKRGFGSKHRRQQAGPQFSEYLFLPCTSLRRC